MKISINNLSKGFNQTVINNLCFEDDVTTLALIGRSGCGKSTLLRLIGGLIETDSGEIYLEDKKALDSPEYRKNIGFVFQERGLFTHLNALENIALPLVKVHGLSLDDAHKKAMALLERFGLVEHAKKLPSQLSGGQRQRICIARAIAPKPKILLLDEPTSALDPEYTTEVLNIIGELKNDGLSFIIATHEIGFALHACDKVAFMNEGVIAEYAKSDAIFTHPQTEELKLFLSKLLTWKV